MANKNFVTSLQRGLSLLEMFTPERPTLKLQELTVRVGLPRTTVFRLLRTLISLNYVRFDPITREYFLGPKVMSLGYATLASLDLTGIARPYLEELSRLTGQNVNLGILDGTEVVYIERITKKQLISTDHTVGSRVSVHATAIGRAILAYMDQEECEEILNELFADPKAVSHLGKRREEFLELLEEARRNGYSFVDEEFIVGIRAIGAPIFSSKGTVEAAINMPVFIGGVSLEKLVERYAPMLVNTADKISASRGFTGHFLKGSESLERNKSHQI